MPVLQIAIIAGCIGALLLFLGLRGRRVGDHPFCRTCGFDLFGKPDDSEICPECGARLLGPRSQVIGVRHRRRWAIASGSFILLPLCGFAGVFAWGRYNGVDWQKHKPLWYLSREAGGSDIPTRDAAIAEIATRYAGGKLPRPQVASVLSQALAAQADASRPWAAAWGDLIESAHAAGDLSAADWKRYAEQAVAGMYVVRYRTKVSSDTPFSYALESRGARVGSRPTLMSSTHVVGLVIDSVERMNRADDHGTGITLSPTPYPGLTYRPVGKGELAIRITMGGGGLEGPQWRVFRGLQPGPHDGYVRVDVNIADMPVRRMPTTRLSPGAGGNTGSISSGFAGFRGGAYTRPTTIDQFELKLPIHIDLVPPGEPLVRRVESPALHDAIAASLHVQNARIMPLSFMSMMVSCVSPPADLSFKVLVRDGAREWPLGSFAYSRREGNSPYPARPRQVQGMLPYDVAGPLGPRIDVVFRADPDAAVSLSPDITEYWGGEDIVIKNVPLILRPTGQTLPLPRAWPPTTQTAPKILNGVDLDFRRPPTTQTAPKIFDGIDFDLQRRQVAPVRGRDTF
jgi:hypothetical protein